MLCGGTVCSTELPLFYGGSRILLMYPYSIEIPLFCGGTPLLY